MITTLLDLLAALLVILALTLLIGTYAPTWATILAAGVMVQVLSMLITRRGAK